MRINAIKTDNQGFKLIAASVVKSMKGCKPIETHTSFFDYKDGLLREFRGNEIIEMDLPSFKAALKWLLIS